MITYTGVHIQKIGGADGTPTPLDIAVHAGRLCRFGGSVWYPLLPHLVYVGLMAYQRSGSIHNMLWGFLHDGHETVTGDIPRPFKCECMRTEQNAIDRRILTQYFGEDGWLDIDYDLIHQCDIDACDIEAVEFEVPNYIAVTTACAKDYSQYRENPHSDESDRQLLKRIRNSSFYRDTLSIDGRLGIGVKRFADLLTDANNGNHIAVRNRVASWNLLEVL